MGYIAHHAMVFTSWNHDAIEAVHEEAKRLGASVSELITSNINKDYSFLIGPDGSGEGWEEDAAGNARRAAIAEFIETLNYEDGSNPISWVSVRYGGDEPHKAEIEARNLAGREKPKYADQYKDDDKPAAP